MAAKVLMEYKQRIGELKLIPGAGGCFELTANGEVIWSKLKEGKFPDESWVLQQLAPRLK